MAKAVLSLIFILFSLSVHAGPQSDALGTCLTDNTNGKERKELAQWIFIAISAHPEMSNLSSVSKQDREKSNKGMADIVMRLLTEDCAIQARAAVNAEGGEGLESSFKVLGRIAMQEIMSNQSVSTSIADYVKFLDQKKLRSALAHE